MNVKNILDVSSFLPHENPKKIIFMLHGYGDSASNFIHIANSLNQTDWKINYFAISAPFEVPNFSSGRQWFDLYPNGKYIANAGPSEIKIINAEVVTAIQQIDNTIKQTMNFYDLKYSDCFLLGFSQGGMMTFEFGKYSQERLGGLAILSGRIMSKESIKNTDLLQTPIFISHGVKDEVLPLNYFDTACEYFKQNKLEFEAHRLEDDTHIISAETIKLLQKFIKKNL